MQSRWCRWFVAFASLTACGDRSLMGSVTPGASGGEGGRQVTASGGASPGLNPAIGAGGAAGSSAGAALQTEVAVGDAHSCELRSDGTLICWGSNDHGAATPPADRFARLAAGTSQNCGVRIDGSILCWGFGYDGVPLYAAPAGSDFVEVSMGRQLGQGRHACALRSNGQIVCWQEDDYGETRPPAGTFKQVSAGHGHTCGLRTDDHVVCWGENDNGQSNSPSGTFLQVSCGDNHNCGVLTNGSVVCWGYAFQGDTTPPTGTFRQVSAGASYTCGVRTDDTIACWGQTSFIDQPAPSGTFLDVTLGGWQICARRMDGSLLCWDGAGVSTPPTPPPGPPDPAAGCPGLPTGSVCQCGGFALPDPSGGGPHASSYVDNGDGTITDQVTKLLWEKAPNPSVDQCPAIVKNGGCSAVQAAAYCASKGTGWRVPSRLELESLVDLTFHAGSQALNPIFPYQDTSRGLRTSTPYAPGAPEEVWFVSFLDGSVTPDDINSPSLVRCVKGTPSCYAARYQVLSGALVHDQATGLTWQQAVAEGDWDHASAICSNIGDGWRVPSLLELQSILDDGRVTPSIDGTAFPGTPPEFFWSSENSPGSSLEGWAVDFAYGDTSIDLRTSVNHVRCVR